MMEKLWNFPSRYYMFGEDVGLLGEWENKTLLQGNMVVTGVNKAEPQGGESLKENEASASSISLPAIDVFSQSLVV